MVDEYSEEDFLQISGIQHFAYCPRQWGLIHIGQVWQDNSLTLTGQSVHKKADNPYIVEKRNDLIVSRALKVSSGKLGINGICDIVEFTRSDHGIHLHNRDGLYTVMPVEYKKGIPKSGNEDILQLTAQVICLEEMFCTDISKAALYYGETHHRTYVDITEELRSALEKIIAEMRRCYSKKHIPVVRQSGKCTNCSLLDVCFPLKNNKSVKSYIESFIGDSDEEAP